MKLSKNLEAASRVALGKGAVVIGTDVRELKKLVSRDGVIQETVAEVVEYIVRTKKANKQTAYSFFASTRTYKMLMNKDLEIWTKPASYIIEKLEQ